MRTQLDGYRTLMPEIPNKAGIMDLLKLLHLMWAPDTNIVLETGPEEAMQIAPQAQQNFKWIMYLIASLDGITPEQYYGDMAKNMPKENIQ